MSDAPKRIWAWPHFDGWITGDWSANTYHDDRTVEYVRADEHDRLMAEKDAEIEAIQALVLELERERDTWHADANLMLGFADLAYEVGAAPTSGELISAKHRAVSSIRNDALEDAARRLLRCFPNMGMIEDFAAAIRAMKGAQE